jgi:hypothetical protein
MKLKKRLRFGKMVRECAVWMGAVSHADQGGEKPLKERRRLLNTCVSIAGPGRERFLLTVGGLCV